MEAEECIRVLVRLRPLNDEEKMGDPMVSLTALPDRVSLHIDEINSKGNSSGGKVFKFDGVIPADEDSSRSQNQLYESQVGPLVDRFVSGYNTTVMAYGQTGSGKTFTMCCIEEHNKGIIPRVLIDLFSRIDGKLHDYSVHVTYVEVHNETLRDILSNKSTLGQPDDELQIREDSEGGIHLHGISPTAVRSIDAAMSLVQQGNRSRATGATEMNQKSSRSHAIFTIYLSSSVAGRVSKFHLVDLAGSERNKRTKNTGTRLKESVCINTGLLALGNVICALSKKPAQVHVPYRDSKLTRLLQDSIGGTCRTTFIACVSPSVINHDETLGTLTYAYRARSIVNTPSLPAKQLLEQLRKEQQIVYFGASTRKCRAPIHNDPEPFSCGECKALREELDDVRQCYSSQKTKTKDLEAELKHFLKEGIRSPCRQCEVSNNRIAELESRFKSPDHYHSAPACSNCHQNETRVRELEEELEADEGIFAEYLRDAKSLEKTNKRQQQHIDELLSERDSCLQKGGNKNNGERDHILRLQNRIEELLQRLHAASEKDVIIGRLEERIEEQRIQSTDHIKHLENRIEQLLPAQHQIEYLQRELDESNRLMTEKGKLVFHLEDKVRQISKQQDTDRDHKIKTLENQIADLLHTNNRLQHFERSNSSPDTAAVLQQKVDQLQTHIESQQLQCDQLREEIQRREDIISKQNNRLVQLSDGNQQREHLKNEVTRMEHVISQQQARIDELLAKGSTATRFLSEEGDSEVVLQLKREVQRQREVIAQYHRQPPHPADVAADRDSVLTGMKSHDIGTSTDIIPIRSRSPERESTGENDNIGFETTIRTAELQSLRERDASLEQLAKDNYYYQRTNKLLKSKLREVANHNTELAEKLTAAERKLERVPILGGKENRTPPFHTSNTPSGSCEVVERDIRTLRKATLEEVAAKQRDRNQTPAIPRSKSDSACGTPSFSQWSPKSLVNYTACFASPGSL
eukprot:TRINITY_DN8893_c0_g1_i1.p1 TRINITY_DN8893_c0_g1~~TRINITY_DN8893_c0_g1_i1.p1  ORF type:complete len:976 (+),score=211.25 TRINITY_DN8893_c0_g1_i1:79-3006(+)